MKHIVPSPPHACSLIAKSTTAVYPESTHDHVAAVHGVLLLLLFLTLKTAGLVPPEGHQEVPSKTPSLLQSNSWVLLLELVPR